MLHEINRGDVITNLLVWMSGVLDQCALKRISSFSEMRGPKTLRKK
jgi:hypothetical protein